MATDIALRTPAVDIADRHRVGDPDLVRSSGPLGAAIRREHRQVLEP